MDRPADGVTFQTEEVVEGKSRVSNWYVDRETWERYPSFWRKKEKKEVKEVYAKVERNEQYAETARELELENEVQYWKARAEGLEETLGEIGSAAQAGLAASHAVGQSILVTRVASPSERSFNIGQYRSSSSTAEHSEFPLYSNFVLNSSSSIPLLPLAPAHFETVKTTTPQTPMTDGDPGWATVHTHVQGGEVSNDDISAGSEVSKRAPLRLRSYKNPSGRTNRENLYHCQYMLEVTENNLEYWKARAGEAEKKLKEAETVLKELKGILLK